MFIQLKEAGSSEKLFIAVDQIVAVKSNGNETTIFTTVGEFESEESFLSVKNRIAKAVD